MAVNIYETVVNPISGESFRAISFNEEAFTMQWALQPKGYVPFEHIHINQDEIFHVQKGELKIIINGKESIVQEGESITVPKGSRHIAFNNQKKPLNCIVEYKPGLDYDKFMQCLLGLTKDNFIDNKGGVNIPMMGYFLVEMKARSIARPTAIPSPAFNIALRFFYIRGLLMGWKKFYKRYTA